MADDNPTPEVTKEKQVENRKPGTWAPGQSGNPNGRPPKGFGITDTIKEMMHEKPEIRKGLAMKVLQLASEGNIHAIKLLWNYLEGMPVQKQEIGGVDGNAIKLAILTGLGFVPAGTTIDATSDDGDAGVLGPVQDASVAPEGEKDDDGNL